MRWRSPIFRTFGRSRGICCTSRSTSRGLRAAPEDRLREYPLLSQRQHLALLPFHFPLHARRHDHLCRGGHPAVARLLEIIGRERWPVWLCRAAVREPSV